MKPLETLMISAALSMLVAGGASADADPGHGSQAAPGQPGAPAMKMQGMATRGHDMMQMMMRMHRGMMNGGMVDGGMMHRGMMPLMQALDADGDGTVTPEEAHEGLQALLAKYDADGDEALSLTEFETLHSALIRESMVDRFQFLDDDGDGRVTMGEIVKPADIMERMAKMRARGAQDGDITGSGPMGAPGQGMMGDN